MSPTSTPEALRREVERLQARVADLESQRDAAVQLFHGDPERNAQPLLEQIPAMVWVTDPELRLTWWTGGAIEALRVNRDDLIGVDMFTYLGTEDREAVPIKAHLGALEGRSSHYEQEMEGTHFSVHVQPQRDADGRITGTIGVGLDITSRIHAEQDRVRLISELQQALERVKKLSGLIPICMHCKSVRNDGGYWQQVETFVHQNSNAEFSHSICPSCMGDALAEVEAIPPGPAKPTP
jgi:PAS domain S-box-containing protein